jgi:methylglutaconyl-CoA hydratase
MINPILTEISAHGVATVTLNNPKKLNAMDKKMIVALTESIKDLQRDNIRLIVIKSEGETFSTGADLNYMKKLAQYNLDKNRQDAELLANLMRTLYQSKKPTLALVQGPAYGGGIGLIACCDIVIASTKATFCFSEVKLGIIPAVICPYIIQAIGPRAAKAYFLAATPFDAHRAYDLGLCHEVTTPGKLNTASKKWIKAILQNGPLAIKAAKRLVNTLTPVHITPEVIDLTTEYLAKLRVSEEGQEGINAFLEKRPPAWSEHGKK